MQNEELLVYKKKLSTYKMTVKSLEMKLDFYRSNYRNLKQELEYYKKLVEDNNEE